MAARSIASLSLTFGLVSVPVKLFSATQSSAGVSFNLLHSTCGSRLKQQYLCAKEGVVVERAEMVKGYEFAKDQYVVFTPEELKALEEKGSQTIEIVAFIPIASVDPIYYDKTYYLAPDKGGARPYALLAQAMRETGRCALARWAWRGKQHMVQVRPADGGLILQQLLYADEVRALAELEIEKAEVKPAELNLAVQLIEQSATDEYDPKAYVDEVKQRIEAAVQQKVEGKEVTIAAEPETGGAQVIDLMEALRASLGKAKPAAPARAEAEAPAPAAAAKTERKAPKRAAAEPATTTREKKRKAS
ncbi:MAG TPA: Ku protein [Burkholderiaceae bacterium]|nr:Ku protein [Burkholderiaceae bacterium]